MKKEVLTEAGQAQQEENLADYAARLEAVLNTVIDGIITINSLGTVQSFNPSAERIFGYKPEEVIGQNVKMLMPDPYHSEHDDYLKNYHKTGEKKVIGIGREVEAQRKDGSIFSMELGISEMKTAGEKMFVGTIRDISERKRHEESLTNYAARLEAVLNTVIDGIITINSLGTIQSFNPSAERIFGYTPEEVIGQNVKMLMPDPYHSEHDDYLKNYHKTGEKKVIGIGREVEAQRKDGSIFSMELGINEMKTSGEKMFVGTIRDISDRKKSEEETLNSQAQMQAILDNAVDGLITIDDKGTIGTFNKACEAIFGYRAEEVVGQNVKMLMPNPYHKEHDGYLKNYHDTGVKKIIGIGREVEGKRKDGSIFPLDLSISGADVKDRKLYSGIVRDVTERKKAIENLTEYSARLEAVLNTVIDGIITINSLGTIQSFNPSAERIFGYTPEEVIGQNVKMLMPDPYHSEHDDYLKNYHETGEKKVIGIGREVEAQRKDGSIFSMELGINEMKTAGEKMFVGTIRDISDRKKSEQETLNSQAKMQAILDNTVDGLITIDDKGSIGTFNKACEAIFGYRAEEVVGQNVKMLMPDPYHREHDGYLKNYHDTGVKKIIGIGREVEGKRKDGSIFPLDLSVSGVDVKGRKLYSGIVRDVTERKEAIENLRQANAELEEFAYRTSHDLRSPLVSSISLLKVAEKSIEEGNQKRATETLAYAQKSLKTLEDLVKDILTLTQMKNAEEDEQTIDVDNLIDVTLDKLRHMDTFERLNIQKTLTFNGELKTKSSRFTLILENLISNAVKYQDANKDDSFIKISTHNDGEYFVLEVQDNGLGIPKEQQGKLFTMFKRFHPKTAFGSGLGLYMMKKSADIIEGKIAFEDTGDGSIFKLFVPIK